MQGERIFIYTSKCFIVRKKANLICAFVVVLFVFYSRQLWIKRSLRCRKNHLKDVALILVFNSPFYENIPHLREMYNGVFGKIVFCGEQPRGKNIKYEPDIVLDIDRGHVGYHCIAKLIQLYPGYSGYLYGNDDMIINWWNLVDRDKTRIWQGPQVVDFRQSVNGKLIEPNWIWWNHYMGLTACRRFYKEMFEKSKTNRAFASMQKIALLNGDGEFRCGKGWSDFFYIPAQFSTAFVLLSEIAYKHRTFLEIAVNNILQSLDEVRYFEIIDGTFLPDFGVRKADPYLFWTSYYNNRLTFIHPFKFKVNQTEYNLMNLKKHVIEQTKYYINNVYCKHIN